MLYGILLSAVYSFCTSTAFPRTTTFSRAIIATASPEIPPPADLPLDAVAPVSEAATTAFQVDEEPLDSASVPDPDPLAVELPSSPPLPTPTFIFDTLNTNGASKPKTNGAAAVDEPEPVGGSGKALAGEVELGHENGDVAVLE